MTPISLLHFLEALLWATIVFVAVTGYGSLALWFCGLRRPSVPLAAVTGFGVVIFFGGCLNLSHAISPAVRVAMIAVGVAAFLFVRPIGIQRAPKEGSQHEDLTRSRWARPVLLLAAFVFLIRLSASVHTAYYQHGDDYNFYLAAPVKMAALHQYAPDPFSERRVMSSLGGNYFLQTLVLSELPLEDIQINIADIPGAASLPPGWPSRSDGEGLAAYLLSQHQRYLVLTVFNLSKVEEAEQSGIDNPGNTEWIRSEDKIQLSSYRQYDQLVHSRHHLYDDGSLIVLDLANTDR